MYRRRSAGRADGRELVVGEVVRGSGRRTACAGLALREGRGGEDCAWLDGVTWMPTDQLPALDAQATDGDAAAVVAGMSDARMSEKVVGTATYAAFRTWVECKGLAHVAVRDAPNA